MTIEPLPPREQARLMSFSDLARNIRNNLREAGRNPRHEFNEGLVQDLLAILQKKAKPPPRPTLPSPPVPPVMHKLPPLRAPNTADYERCLNDFNQTIAALERDLLTCRDEERKQRSRHIEPAL